MTNRRDDLVYGGICPVCGEEFVDGYDELEEGQSYDARICVDVIDGDGGKMLVHLPGLDDGTEQRDSESKTDRGDHE